MDPTLTKVLHEGIFTGINEFGHALLKKEGSDELIGVSVGRMR